MNDEAWQQGWWRSARRVDSPNFGCRPEGCSVSLVVLHNISLPPGRFGEDFVEQFFTNRLDPSAHPYFATIAQLQVSAHFFLRRNGEVLQFVSGDRRAWHAGQSAWLDRPNCNDYSIGIEIEGCDTQPFAEAQYAALWPLLAAILRAYPIIAVAGHEHVAPGRKTDPGPWFDWGALAQHFPGLILPVPQSASFLSSQIRG